MKFPLSLYFLFIIPSSRFTYFICICVASNKVVLIPFSDFKIALNSNLLNIISLSFLLFQLFWYRYFTILFYFSLWPFLFYRYIPIFLHIFILRSYTDFSEYQRPLSKGVRGQETVLHSITLCLTTLLYFLQLHAIIFTVHGTNYMLILIGKRGK